MDNIQEPLLEVIPETELELLWMSPDRFQGDAMYRFRRLPVMEELNQSSRLLAIYQPNHTVIVIGRPYGFIDGCIFFYEANHIRCFALEYDDRCLQYSSWTSFVIVGKSDYAIAETAAFLWGVIDDGSRPRHIHCPPGRFDFGVLTIEQLAALLLRSSYTGIQLTVTHITPAQSEFIAHASLPLSLDLTHSFDSFLDGGHIFVESLFERQSRYGRLGLQGIDAAGNNEMFQRLLQAQTIYSIDVSLTWARPQLIQQLLSASVEGVDFLIDVDRSFWLDWSSVDIFPKRLVVRFSRCALEAHIYFISSFLRRLSELNHIEFLELDLEQGWATNMPESIAQELLHVIASNQRLVYLRLRRAFSNLKDHLKDVFAAMEYHESLRFVTIDEYPKQSDPDFSMLKHLLKRNRFIDVLGRCEKIGTKDGDGDTIVQIYAINTFFRNSSSLTQALLTLLPSLMCEALIRCASAHFPRSALLLASHPGVLCELVQYSHLLSSTSSDTNVEDELDGFED
jgi:hypothetical protein